MQKNAKGIQNNDEYMNYQKLRDNCHFTGKYRGALHSICNLKFKMPNEIPVVFYNGSNYDYHFIMNDFKGQFKCLGENKEKFKTFSLPIKKEITKIDKDGNESVESVVNFTIKTY